METFLSGYVKGLMPVERYRSSLPGVKYSTISRHRRGTLHCSDGRLEIRVFLMDELAKLFLGASVSSPGLRWVRVSRRCWAVTLSPLSRCSVEEYVRRSLQTVHDLPTDAFQPAKGRLRPTGRLIYDRVPSRFANTKGTLP